MKTDKGRRKVPQNQKKYQEENRMNAKKILSVLLAVIMCLSMLAAVEANRKKPKPPPVRQRQRCSGCHSGSNELEGEITFWHSSCFPGWRRCRPQQTFYEGQPRCEDHHRDFLLGRLLYQVPLASHPAMFLT